MDAQALAEACGAISHTATPITSRYGEGVRVELHFEQGWAKLDWYPELVYWQTLRSETDERIGLYDELARRTPPFFKQHGVKRYLASPKTPKEKLVLETRGDWHDHEGRIEWVL